MTVVTYKVPFTVKLKEETENFRRRGPSVVQTSFDTLPVTVLKEGVNRRTDGIETYLSFCLLHLYLTSLYDTYCEFTRTYTVVSTVDTLNRLYNGVIIPYLSYGNLFLLRSPSIFTIVSLTLTRPSYFRSFGRTTN